MINANCFFFFFFRIKSNFLKGAYNDKNANRVTESKVRMLEQRWVRGLCLPRSKRAVGDFSPPRISLAAITPLPDSSIVSK